MGRGYKTSRDLVFRLPKNTRILYKIGDVIRKAKYTGNGNIVKYRGLSMTVNQFCSFVKTEITPNAKRNVNVWVTAYVQMKSKPVRLRDIPILPKYKKYENDILNNTYLKEKNDNNNNPKDIDLNMARKKTQKKSTRITKEQSELERKLREYDIKMGEWWNKQPKEIIEDSDEFTTVVFATRKLEDNIYEMLNQNKQRIGIVRPWIDKNGQYPPQFKNENNVVTPIAGIPEYEYLLDNNSPFHDMPKSTYYKYKFTKVFNKFILTDEIRTYNPSE